ncbi:MAG: hypothetical protein ACREOI_01815 [bacterium]
MNHASSEKSPSLVGGIQLVMGFLFSKKIWQESKKIDIFLGCQWRFYILAGYSYEKFHYLVPHRFVFPELLSSPNGYGLGEKRVDLRHPTNADFA